MWFDDVPGRSWTRLWSGYVLCGGGCPAIRKITEACPACEAPAYDLTPTTEVIDGRKITLNPTFMGAEGRYEDYIYLQMLQREWERPASEFEHFANVPDASRPSARAALVLLFWGYFETRIERLFRVALRSLPPRILESQLKRHSGIGSRLYEFYKIAFDTNYFDDLTAHGFHAVACLLKDIHQRRNEFTHGAPQNINDATVEALVTCLRDEHEAWITVFNSRVRSGPTV